MGVSNWGVEELRELLQWEGLRVRPAVNQIEVHPFHTQSDVVSIPLSLGGVGRGADGGGVDEVLSGE